MELILVLSVATVIIVSIAYWLYKNTKKQIVIEESAAPYKIEAPADTTVTQSHADDSKKEIENLDVDSITEAKRAVELIQVPDVPAKAAEKKPKKKQKSASQINPVNKAKIEKASKPRSKKPKMTVAK